MYRLAGFLLLTPKHRQSARAGQIRPLRENIQGATCASGQARCFRSWMKNPSVIMLAHYLDQADRIETLTLPAAWISLLSKVANERPFFMARFRYEAS